MNAPLLLVILAALSVGGCAGFSKDGGFNDVAGATRTHLAKDLKWPRTDAERAKVAAEVAELLAQPLSADDAVQIALLNNRGLQASFEELGVSEADLVQSGRLPNPRRPLRPRPLPLTEVNRYAIGPVLGVLFDHSDERLGRAGRGVGWWHTFSRGSRVRSTQG